jgi:hypothetical protein
MTDKDSTFDPYHKWLGIPREQRPVTLYQLLGISAGETDVEVIEDAATRQSTHVRTYQLGSQAEVCQRILNEIAQARSVVLNPKKRMEYYANLAKAARPRAEPVPSPFAGDWTQTALERTPPATERTRPKKANTRMIVGLAAGGVVVVAALVGAGAWLSSGPDSPPTARKIAAKVESAKTVANAEKKTPPPVELVKIVEPKKSPEPAAKNPGNVPPLPSETETPVAKKEPPKVDRKPLQATWPTRQAEPDADALAAKLKALHERMPPPGPRGTVIEIDKHAKGVLALGLETKDDVPMRYAALREAFEFGYPLGDPAVADRALQALALDFVVESAALKTAALSRAVAKTVDPGAILALADSIDEIVGEAIATDDLDNAEKASALGVVAAQKTKDAALTSAAVRRLAQIRTAAQAYRSFKSAQETLAKTPDDAKACAEAGKYLSLVKGDWDSGLKLLARGGDTKLKALAQKDVEAPTDTDAREALGNAWADLAHHDPGPFQAKAAARAAHWYAMILADAPALKRLAIEKRMAEFEKFLAPMRGPQPAARWTFDIDARDVIGSMHASLRGNPKFVQGRMLMRPGDKFYAMLPFDVSERTLEMWCCLPKTNLRGPILIFIKDSDQNGEVPNNARWDGIQFSDTIAGKLFPTSEKNRRSRDLDIPLENSRPDELLHLAAVYAKDNTITIYRNGAVLGQPFVPERTGANNDLVTYRAGKSAVKIGSELTMEVEEARLYTRALSAAEIAMSYRTFKK